MTDNSSFCVLNKDLYIYEESYTIQQTIVSMHKGVEL